MTVESQYTFKGSYISRVALVLNEKRLLIQILFLKINITALYIKDEKELVTLLKKWPGVVKINNNAKKMLEPHINVKW